MEEREKGIRGVKGDRVAGKRKGVRERRKGEKEMKGGTTVRGEKELEID